MLPVTLLLVAAPRFQLRRADGANGLAAEASRAVNSHTMLPVPIASARARKDWIDGNTGKSFVAFFALFVL